mmetsp:Transcript_22087/g.48043  ORF Transcript_22087/g.48043 Transcript_22087/m.48043 type:complete len:341 (+) Transcript_22087:91-1113(+)
MPTVYLVSGGARSGKSGYAQSLCEYLSPEPIYLATSKVFDNDDDFAKRVEKHRGDRGEQWTTIEEPLEPSKYLEEMKGRVVLVDCCTLWLTNYMMEEGLFSLDDDGDDKGTKKDGPVQDAAERALRKIEEEFDKMTQPWNCTYVMVTNEIGSGTHAHDHTTRKFVDAQGWFNQYVAKRAEAVVHMVCGVPNVVKGPLSKPSLSNAVRASVGAAPTLEEAQRADMLDHYLSKRDIAMDPKGYFKFRIDTEKKIIFASYHSCIMNDKGEFFDLEGNRLRCHGKSPEPVKVWECRTAKELTTEILEKWEMAPKVMNVGHGGYVGREAQKAEDALYSGKQYRQD